MDNVMIKSYGTPEELEMIEEICKAEGLEGEFDEKGEMFFEEDYTFGRGDIDSFVRKIISRVPSSKLYLKVYYNDDVSGQDRYSVAEYDTEKLVYKGTGWYYPPVDKDNLHLEDDEDGFVDEFTYCGYHYMWRKGYEKPEVLDDEEGDGFEWYGKKYKWDYIEETVIKGASEVKIKAIADNVSELNDFGALLLAHMPLEIGFDDIHSYFEGEFGNRSGKVLIDIIRYDIDKAEVDKFAESIGIVMPDSKYVVLADFKDGDSYKYVYMDDKILCGRKTGEDEYERTDMNMMTEDEKKAVVFDESDYG